MASHTAVETLEFNLAESSQTMGPARSASQELIQKPAPAPLGFLDPLAEKWINSAQVYDDSLRKERTCSSGLHSAAFSSAAEQQHTCLAAKQLVPASVRRINSRSKEVWVGPETRGVRRTGPSGRL